MKDSAEYREAPDRIAYLIAGFLQGKLTPSEHDELDAWIEASEENMRLFEELTDEDKLEAAQAYFVRRESQKKEKEQRYATIRKRLGLGYSNQWVYIAAAAILVLGIGILWWVSPGKDGGRPNIAQEKPALPEQPDKVMLTLSDGKKMVLDSNGKDLSLEGANVRTGELVYTGKGAGKEIFNTLTVPRGAQYKISLSDGTTVWLNCESSLTYPVSFTGPERKVVLSGEGYFEVARDAGRPFSVIRGDQRVTVLGTKFNVEGYAGEDEIKTTLLEGKVKVEKGLFSAILEPGRQAVASEGGIRIREADVAGATAWKNGLFLFRNATIQDIARQLKRWYGVEIVYKGEVKEHFNATVPRREKLERVLQVLEGSGFVHFDLQGNTLMIQP